ncbi:MAG TPA: DUF1153 domain-containing protein [Rhizomicrobium sp.]|nr:DUF1153 domain-containing protein [Rhizomicrobium sp.]
MSITEVRDVGGIFGSDGSPLDLINLPSPQTKRWVIRRKAEVLAAVRGGLLSVEDACKRYAISMDEFLAWSRALDRFGPNGLRAMRIYRSRKIGNHRPER